MKPVTEAYQNNRVEFPSQLRKLLPVGTSFMITAKVCQKHNKDGSKRGKIYLKAYDIKIVLPSEENLPNLEAALKQTESQWNFKTLKIINIFQLIYKQSNVEL